MGYPAVVKRMFPNWIAGVFCLLLWVLPGHAESCRTNTVTLRGDWGQARFNVEVVDTIETRARGLMFRETLPMSAGMLFVYQRPQKVAFWMKNTLIPLDMIFVDPRGVVQRVHHNAVPGDMTEIPGGRNIMVVLEINGGLARRLGISEGSEMRHPAFDGRNAVWPCP
ncbi:MAG: hypothetical protein CSA70_09995 [Rhodobacterales bacterium]|nr:MAG: hypothetical protein CSA70_09995 [Rhodobacterales bacterium]